MSEIMGESPELNSEPTKPENEEAWGKDEEGGSSEEATGNIEHSPEEALGKINEEGKAIEEKWDKDRKETDPRHEQE